MALHNATELQQYILKDVKQTGRNLGYGSFGRVEELIYAGARCAGKIIHEKFKQTTTRKIKNEWHILAALRHPNIVQFLGICYVPESDIPVLVIELLDKDLDTFLLERNTPSIVQKINILLDVAKGLVFLHSRSPSIIHCDLTARNVLLTSVLQAKISDLTNVHIIESNVLMRTLCTQSATLAYMPPEAMDNPPNFDGKFDIFSFGHIALYVALQEYPYRLLVGDYKGRNGDNVGNEHECRGPYIEKLHASFGPDHTITKLVMACLHDHPQCRPSTSEVLDDLQKLYMEHHPTLQSLLEGIQVGLFVFNFAKPIL